MPRKTAFSIYRYLLKKKPQELFQNIYSKYYEQGIFLNHLFLDTI